MIHQKISKLLNKRQDKSSIQTNNISAIDEIKKYNELLDSGLMAQEEFEAKKKAIIRVIKVKCKITYFR